MFESINNWNVYGEKAIKYVTSCQHAESGSLVMLLCETAPTWKYTLTFKGFCLLTTLDGKKRV